MCVKLERMKPYKSFACDVSPQTGSTRCWLKTKKVMINSSGHKLGSLRDLCGSECYEISEGEKKIKSAVCSSSGILTSRHMTDITTNSRRVTSWPSLWPNIHLLLRLTLGKQVFATALRCLFIFALLSGWIITHNNNHTFLLALTWQQIWNDDLKANVLTFNTVYRSKKWHIFSWKAWCCSI